MSEEPIKLATQVVILLAALVGLYKVSKGTSEQKAPSPAGAPSPGNFDAFLSMAGVYATALMPIIFLALFVGLMTWMSSLSSASKKPDQKTAIAAPQIAIASPTDTERSLLRQLEVARLVNKQDDQDRLLTLLVDQSLNAKSPRVAVAVASSISTISNHDAALERVLVGALKMGDLDAAAAAASRITMIDAQDRALERVFMAAASHQNAGRNDASSAQAASKTTKD